MKIEGFIHFHGDHEMNDMLATFTHVPHAGDNIFLDGKEHKVIDVTHLMKSEDGEFEQSGIHITII